MFYRLSLLFFSSNNLEREKGKRKRKRKRKRHTCPNVSIARTPAAARSEYEPTPILPLNHEVLERKHGYTKANSTNTHSSFSSKPPRAIAVLCTRNQRTMIARAAALLRWKPTPVKQHAQHKSRPLAAEEDAGAPNGPVAQLFPSPPRRTSRSGHD